MYCVMPRRRLLCGLTVFFLTIKTSRVLEPTRRCGILLNGFKHISDAIRVVKQKSTDIERISFSNIGETS